MDRLVHDLRIALRGLRRSPTFAVATVLILGLGIGMAVAMWTTVNAVLMRRLPVEDQRSARRALDIPGPHSRILGAGRRLAGYPARGE